MSYKFQNESAVVWWMRSQESATLASDYAALAVKLDARFATEPNLNTLIDFVREWLRVNERWLLIFDNANAPDEIRAYLPPVGSGHILITSRESVWDEIGKTVALPTLPREEAIRFLVDYTGDANHDAANALANELGDFPLALEHARAYVKQPNTSLARYLELYRTRRTELWRDTKAPLNYHSTIATTWDISLHQAAAQAPASADLLNLCAFFAPDNIPLDVIRDGAEFLPSESSLASNVKQPVLSETKDETSGTILDEMILDNAIAALRHYSLIQRDGDNLSVHRLVQAVTREKLDENTRKQWAEAAVRIVDEAFPGDAILTDVESWKICARLLQHGLAAAEQAENDNIAPDQTARLLNQMGLYLKGRAQYQEAKILYERALAIDEQQFGPEHPNVAIRVNNLGSLSYAMGEIQEAKKYHQRALTIREKFFGAEHPDVAQSIWWLGTIAEREGDEETARACLERALKIFQKFLGDEHPNTRGVKGNLERLGE